MERTQCRRRGQNCATWAIDSRGTLLVLDDRPVHLPMCAPCKAEVVELLAPLLDAGVSARWPKSPPLRAPDGTLWRTSEARELLEMNGLGHVVSPRGSLTPAAVNMWRGLVAQNPGVLDQVRAHMSRAVAELLRDQVEKNRHS